MPGGRDPRLAAALARSALVLALLADFALCASAAAQGPIPSIGEKTRGMTRMPGLFNLRGPGARVPLPGLDGLGAQQQPSRHRPRAAPGNEVLKPMRVGPRERAAVQDAFAPSVHWGFDIAAETGGSILGPPQPRDKYRQKVLNIVQRAVADPMVREAGFNGNPAEVRAVLSDRLDQLAVRIEGMARASPHATLVAADIRRWQSRPANTEPAPKLQMPPGDPIGGSSR